MRTLSFARRQTLSAFLTTEALSITIFKQPRTVYARVVEGGPLSQQVKEFFSKEACDRWLKENISRIKVISLTVITPSTSPNNGALDMEHGEKYILTYEDKT